jgi:hypothetical protein
VIEQCFVFDGGGGGGGVGGMECIQFGGKEELAGK